MRLLLLLCAACVFVATHAAKSERIRRTRNDLKCHKSSLSTCQCHNKNTVDCNTPDCLSQLPTSEFSSADRTEIKFLRVKKQRNLTEIRQDDLNGLKNLEWIQFSSNNIARIDDRAFAYQRELVKLDLHGNQLTEVPRAIGYLPKLRKLNLGGNRITTIRRDDFSRQNKLETLILRRNMLNMFPENLPQNLIKLSLVQNHIASVGDATYLQRLELLRLDGNRLTAIPNARHNISSRVSELTMCSNNLTSASLNRRDALAGLTELRRLRLSGNMDITRVTSDFLSGDGAQTLRELELGLCSIEEISSDAFSCARELQHLGLAGNKLRYYDDAWVAYNRRLRSMRLANNQWHCTCEFIAQLKGLESAVGERIRQVMNRHRGQNMDKIATEFKTDFNDTRCEDADNELVEMDYPTTSNVTSYWNSACVSRVGEWKFQKRQPAACARDVEPSPISTTERSTTTRRATTRRTTTTRRATTRRTTTTARPTTKRATTRRTTTTTKPATTRRTTTTTAPTTTTTTTAAPSHYPGVCGKTSPCYWPIEEDGTQYDGSKCISSWSGKYCYPDAAKSSWQYCGESYC